MRGAAGHVTEVVETWMAMRSWKRGAGMVGRCGVLVLGEDVGHQLGYGGNVAYLNSQKVEDDFEPALWKNVVGHLCVGFRVL